LFPGGLSLRLGHICQASLSSPLIAATAITRIKSTPGLEDGGPGGLEIAGQMSSLALLSSPAVDCFIGTDDNRERDALFGEFWPLEIGQSDFPPQLCTCTIRQ
jgi:hypothetical protein